MVRGFPKAVRDPVSPQLLQSVGVTSLQIPEVLQEIQGASRALEKFTMSLYDNDAWLMQEGTLEGAWTLKLSALS